MDSVSSVSCQGPAFHVKAGLQPAHIPAQAGALHDPLAAYALGDWKTDEMLSLCGKLIWRKNFVF